MKQLILIFLLLSAPVFGNPGGDISILGTVTGTVLDQDFQEPIPYATISVSNSAGEIVTGTVSSMEGTFSLEKLPEGTYTFKVQFMGYVTFTQEVEISSSRQTIELGNIYLKPAVAELDDVTVVAEVSTIEQRIDRKVINVGKDLTTAGASAADIMNNIPSVSVDQDGNLSLRGNPNVRILIDGKPSNMDAATILKTIPSTSIKQIELITNPSAKYNPEGMSGIINIILHKNSNLGFNGDFSGGLTFGERTSSNASLNLNYRQGKFNFYTNLGAVDRKNVLDAYILNLEDNSGEFLDFAMENQAYMGKVGVDFFMDDKNVFSIYTNQVLSFEELDGVSAIRYNDDPSQNIDQLTHVEDENRSQTYNFDYRHFFNEDGHEIELEVDHDIYSNEDDANFSFNGPAGQVGDAYRDDVTKDYMNTTINLDYVNPFSETAKLELGAESRIRKTENTYISTRAGSDDILFDYDNNIHSLYATFGQNFDQWAYQMGARLESFDVEAEEGGEKIYSDDYITLYPSAFVTYTPGEKNSFQLSYSRRVDRPSNNQVNPVRQISTPRMTISGNPSLRPQFTNSLEANYTRKMGKNSITAGVFYRIINDEINQIILEDPVNPAHLFLTFRNSDDNTAYGAELSGNFKPASFWDLSMNFNLYSQTERGVIGTESLEVETNSFSLQSNNNFKVTKNLKLQLFGMYNAPVETLQFHVDDSYFVNLGARYSFLKDKASLSVNLNDVFESRYTDLNTTRPIAQKAQFKNDSRMLYVGFTYRFGGSKPESVERKNRDDNTSSGGGVF